MQTVGFPSSYQPANIHIPVCYCNVVALGCSDFVLRLLVRSRWHTLVVYHRDVHQCSAVHLVMFLYVISYGTDFLLNKPHH